METLFRKHFWVVHATGFVTLGALLALAANAFLGAAIAPWTVAGWQSGDGQRSAALPFSDDYIPPRLFGAIEPAAPPDPCADVTCEEGQICNPETGACVPSEAEAEEETSALGPADGRCLDSDLNIVLVGTIVSPDPATSLVVLHDPTEQRTRFAQIGTRILGEGEVIRIERNRVFLNREGVEECLRPGTVAERTQRRASQSGQGRSPTQLGRGDQASSGPGARAPRPGAAAASVQPTQSLEARIQTAVEQLAPNEFSVDREVLQEVTQNQAMMQQQAPQIQPVYRDGRPAGFQLGNVRMDSIFGRIGIRSGDVIRAVNGQALDSPQRALDFYERLGSQSEVRLDIERRGRTQTLTYRLR